MSLKPFFLGAFIAAAGMAAAHEGATGIVKERMDGMKSMGKALKSVVATVTSGENDAQVIAAAAQVFSDQGGMALVERFPQGETSMVSEAAPLIWEEPGAFADLAMDLQDLAGLLAASASDASIAPAEVVARIGDNCKACHKDFRIKK